MSFPEFCRRYGTIEKLDVPLNTPDAVQEILMLQEVPSHTYKLGISQVFLRSGILPKLDQRVEAHTHSSMVLFQARCRGYLGRKRFRELEVLDSAAYVIQSNVAVWTEIRDWSWWQLYTKVRQNRVWGYGRMGYGVWQNGVMGVWQNGVWLYGVWQNGVSGSMYVGEKRSVRNFDALITILQKV